MENDFDVDDNGVFRSDSVSSSASMSYIFRQSVDSAYKLKTQSMRVKSAKRSYLGNKRQSIADPEFFANRSFLHGVFGGSNTKLNVIQTCLIES